MQLLLPFGPIVNREFLSNHWLDERLRLEPEWNEFKDQAKQAAAKLIALWSKEKDRVARYGDEAGLEEKFIQPVFEILGWSIKYQAFLQGREPDYALFTDDGKLGDAIMAGRGNPDFWLHADMVADAKAWHVSLDRPQKIGSRREYPPEQIEWYLDRSRCDFGILTNGRLWRLVPRDIERSRPRFQTYIEVDLPALIERIITPQAQLQFEVLGPDLELFMRFFLLFSVHGFAPIAERKPLIQRAVDGSSEHAFGVSEELKERVFEALRLSIEGLIRYEPNGLDPGKDLPVCQSQSFVLLYRLLFILYAEDRGLLPYRRNETYTRNRSLARFRTEVATKLDHMQRGLDRAGFSRTSTSLWAELKALFDIIDSGHKRYDVPSYNGGLFNAEDHAFLEEKAISDHYVALILDQLSRAPHRDRPELGLFRVDYRDLAIQQLGSVYEGLLELRPRYATEDMKVVRKRGPGNRVERIVPAREAAPQGFEPTATVYTADSVYLETDKGERRAFGSYYTPDHIVNHMVDAALSPVLRGIEDVLRTEIESIEGRIALIADAERTVMERERDQLAGSFDDRVLTLRILDPAMGSAHFLIRACQYLAEEIATNPFTSDPDADRTSQDEASLLFWKRRVAEQCLYGVDVNPMAVELAKLALWLETVAVDAPLAFLDHHFRTGDSLIGARIPRLDSLPGNALVTGIFEKEITEALPSLLEPLSEIRAIPSSSLEDVKRKEQLFKRRFRAAEQRFENVADVWCASALGAVPEGASPANYAAVVQTLAQKRKNGSEAADALIEASRRALEERGVVCFHWELAFPEVFLADDPDPGFDVIIGNPPYDVLAEKEAGPRVAILHAFIPQDPSLAPSLVGKNNLYKLFVCRALELVRSGGYVSFIVPMALLGDEQSSGIRRMLLAGGEFSQIHAFPQKDNPALRVFKDAKLSTALFVFRKLRPSARTDGRFVSRVHPARFIEASSPPLVLNSNSIRLYDPENLTIVSCRQEDWDLAASLSEQAGTRLKDFVPFFQGEVNQTVATSHGHLTDKLHGPLVIRGANISLYQLREASQGEDIYLDVDAFLAGKGALTKAFHHRYERIGLQETSPQNNFRRIISCRIPSGHFCNHKINYTTAKHSIIPLELVLFVLNSAFADWYFRLGSTNAAVSHYQLTNIPCPAFGRTKGQIDAAFCQTLDGLLGRRLFDQIGESCVGLAESEGTSPTIEQAIITLVRFIEAEEGRRGDIARTARSNLATDSNACQVVLDKIMLTLLGLGAARYDYIKTRLSEML